MDFIPKMMDFVLTMMGLQDRAAIYESLAETLAALHRVDVNGAISIEES